MVRVPRMVVAVTMAWLVAGTFNAAQTPGESASAQASGCLGIVMPKMQLAQGDVGSAAMSLRDMFAEYLKGPTLKTVALEAKLTSQAIEEARQKGCDRVLLVTLTQKRSGGGSNPMGRVIGGAAGAAVYHVPGGGSAASAAARGAVIGGTHAVTSIASSTRKKDELRLEYRIDTVNGQPFMPSKTEQAKARDDGQDLLTPLVEKASEAVAAAIAVR